VLGWTPRRRDLETIVRHACNWLHEFTMAEWQAIQPTLVSCCLPYSANTRGEDCDAA
jgi:hypothetical protein